MILSPLTHLLLFIDGTCGLLSLLPNMFRHYGWNPGERATRWFGECLAVKTRNPDITFQEVRRVWYIECVTCAVSDIEWVGWEGGRLYIHVYLHKPVYIYSLVIGLILGPLCGSGSFSVANI